MALSLLIGTAAVSVAAPAMKTAASEGYRKKVKAMKVEGNFEYLSFGEVTYHYTRPLRVGSTRAINEPIYSSIAQMKQCIEGNGENRILVVTRNRENGSVNFILLKSPAINSKNKHFYEKDPLHSCSIDPNLKTNQGGIVESRHLKVVRKNSNTFLIEDTKYRTIQTHKKILEIQVKNTTKKTYKGGNGQFSGASLCELLNHMAKDGRVPKHFPSILTRDSVLEDEKENKPSSSSLSSSSSSSIPSHVDETVSSISSATLLDDFDDDDDDDNDDDDVVTVENNKNEDVDLSPAITTNVDSNVSSSAEVTTSKYEMSTIINATVTATVISEHDDEVIPVAMATPVE